MAALALMAIATGPAAAQLYGNFAARDNHAKNPVNIWFGAVRDASGRFMPRATIVLATRQVDFVAVTDARGRFRLELPVNIRPADVVVRCSRKGYGKARISRRLPRGGARTPVEVQCTLS